MRVSVAVAAIAISLSIAGCTSPDAEKVKKLEAENRVLTQFRMDVIKMDGLGTEGGIPKESEDSCGKSEILILRVPMSCVAEMYAQGMRTRRDALRKTDIRQETMTDAMIAQWAMVAELNNRYRELDSYGKTRFKAVAASVGEEDFRAGTSPKKVQEYIRNYMYLSQKEFVEGLMRTTAGEKTAMSVKKGLNGVEPNKTASIIEGKREVAQSARTGTRESDVKQPLNNLEASKWTYDQAMKEACEAGRQYREDVDLNGMKPSQARYEAEAYSQHLADNSPAPRKALYDRIQQGLWMDSCK